jgi:hypothetical protein
MAMTAGQHKTLVRRQRNRDAPAMVRSRRWPPCARPCRLGPRRVGAGVVRDLAVPREFYYRRPDRRPPLGPIRVRRLSGW